MSNLQLGVVKNIVVDDVEFYNYEGTYGVSKKTLIRKVQRFMNENPIIETDDMFIDVKNILKRKFACCREHCDLLIMMRQAKKGLFSMGNDQNNHMFDKSCCEGGSYPMSEETIANVDEHLEEIIKVLPEENQQIIRSKGWLRGKKDRRTRTRKSDDMCIMAYESGNMMYCAMHSYALAKGEDILKYKPYDCSIFPMDFLIVNGKILVTTISDGGETAEILRWGDIHMSQACVHKHDKGDPMYQYGKETISHVVGEENWNLIDKIFKDDKWRKLLEVE